MVYKNLEKRRENYLKYYKNNSCLDCKKKISIVSKRCKSCEDKRRWKLKDYSLRLREKINEGIRKSPKRFKSKKCRDKYGKTNIGRKNLFLSEWNKIHNPLIPKYKKLEIYNKGMRKYVTEEEFIKIRLKRLCKKPTKPEKMVIDLIKQNNLPFEYVGDGKIIISNLNPDFISTDRSNKIIEVFNRFWHQNYKNIDYKRTESGRRKIFVEKGYKLLILWDDEMLDRTKVLNKIVDYIKD